MKVRDCQAGQLFSASLRGAQQNLYAPAFKSLRGRDDCGHEFIVQLRAFNTGQERNHPGVRGAIHSNHSDMRCGLAKNLAD